MKLDQHVCYRAIQTRDGRFDGKFFTAVRTTGIYCRPICPARTPKIENCLFFPSAGAAHQAGFRPCLRCRPESAPGLDGWTGTDEAARRALNLIADGALDTSSVEELAVRLGITSRHLRRLFQDHLGASPVAVAQAHRILFAKKLLTETALPITEVAFASGFGSIRRFNDVMRQTFARAPRDLRREVSEAPARTSAITLRLAYRPPFNWRTIVAYLAPRAIPGVEWVDESRYIRTFAVDGCFGFVQGRPVHGADGLEATVWTSQVTALPWLVGRLRRLFDLDTDVATIEAHLTQDPLFSDSIIAHAGLRVPGAWDGFEIAVRAILGEEASVSAATALAGQLVAAYGQPLPDVEWGYPMVGARTFPTPQVLAQADLSCLGVSHDKAMAISGVARAMIAHPDLLSPYQNVQFAIGKLREIPGIGPGTIAYIGMRVLRDADAFPACPLQLAERAEAWRPWRAYAAMHLWLKELEDLNPNTKGDGHEP